MDISRGTPRRDITDYDVEVAKARRRWERDTRDVTWGYAFLDRAIVRAEESERLYNLAVRAANLRGAGAVALVALAALTGDPLTQSI